MRAFRRPMSLYLAVIPAAGTGSRVGGTLPKQYLVVGGHPLLYFAIARMHAHAAIERVCVALAPEDPLFEMHDWTPFAAKLAPLYVGGNSRAATVLNALEAISGEADADDWILVHDAARPCLSALMLDQLIDGAGDDQAGGLLAVPVALTAQGADHDRPPVPAQRRTRFCQASQPGIFRHVGPLP